MSIGRSRVCGRPLSEEGPPPSPSPGLSAATRWAVREKPKGHGRRFPVAWSSGARGRRTVRPPFCCAGPRRAVRGPRPAPPSSIRKALGRAGARQDRAARVTATSHCTGPVMALIVLSRTSLMISRRPTGLPHCAAHALRGWAALALRGLPLGPPPPTLAVVSGVRSPRLYVERWWSPCGKASDKAVWGARGSWTSSSGSGAVPLGGRASVPRILHRASASQSVLHVLQPSVTTPHRPIGYLQAASQE